MTRLLVPLVAVAILAGLPSCATESERHPGVRLRRSDALYAHEDFGDPGRRRERDGGRPFRNVGGKLQRFFTGRDALSH